MLEAYKRRKGGGGQARKSNTWSFCLLKPLKLCKRAIKSKNQLMLDKSQLKERGMIGFYYVSEVDNLRKENLKIK